MSGIEDKKNNHKTISISVQNYQKMLSMGDMTTSFNDILDDLMKKANTTTKETN
jgi:predicted CopG family antitoxin